MWGQYTTRLGGAAVAAVALLAAVPSPAVATAYPEWTVAPAVPVPGAATNSLLDGIVAVSARDVWGVGTWWNAKETDPLLVHWDGAEWTAPALPVVPENTYLSGVDASSATDIWAVGSTRTQVGQLTPDEPTLLHDDGTGWRAVTPPVPAGSSNDLEAVDLRTRTDGWAVGQTTAGRQPAEPLILHLRSGKWSVAATPDVPQANLVAVSARAADDVWAVGTQTDVTGANQALALHFDGATWTQVSIPAPAGTRLNAVTVTGTGDVWAGGAACADACTPQLWHRSAGIWRPVPTVGGTEVTALVAFSPDNVWTLGYQLLPNGPEADHVEHWDGRHLAADDTGLAPGRPPGGPRGEIASALPIAAASGDATTGTLWAVGWSQPPAITPRVIRRG